MEVFSLRVPEACTRYGIGRTALYALIRQKKITAIKLGARTLVIAASVESYLSTLPRMNEA